MKFKCPGCHKKFHSDLSSSAIRTPPKCPKCGLSVNEENIHVGLLGRLYAWMFTKREHKKNSEQVCGTSLVEDLFDGYQNLLKAEEAVIQEREMHALYSIGNPRPHRFLASKDTLQHPIDCSGHCLSTDAIGRLQQIAVSDDALIESRPTQISTRSR